MTKTSQSHPLQLSSLQSIQPWLRDHYAALRAGAGPRWEHTRAVVVPVVVDTSHKVRHDLVPAAAHLSSRVANEAMERSAPLRTEVSNRAAATMAAAHGGVSAKQIERIQHSNDHHHRKFWFISGAAAIGAVLGTAAVLWQRARGQAWVEDDAVHTALDADAATNSANNAMDHHDDPANPDGGVEANATPSGKRAGR